MRWKRQLKGQKPQKGVERAWLHGLIGKEWLALEKLVVELTNARAQDYDEAYFIEQY
jgi:hypothetical protein